MILLPKTIWELENFKIMGKQQKILFRGYLKNGKAEGFGIMYNFGDLYIGSFKNGLKHGYGIWKCKKGYKMVGNRCSRFMYRGFYIGYFFKDKIHSGKLISFDSGEFVKIDIRKKKYTGRYIRFNNDFFLKTYVRNSIFNGSYFYENLKKKYKITGYFLHNNFEGQTYHIYQDYYEIFFYKNGKIKGHSLYHIFEENISFLFQWKDGFRNKLLKIFNKKNQLYYPELFLKNIPIEYLCPIGYSIMLEPAKNEKNQIYDTKNIIKWYHTYKKKTDPLTNCSIENFKIENLHELQYIIYQYIYKNLFSETNKLYLV